jgi:hypothetical protein
MEKETNLIFKSYLRFLLRDLKNIKKAIETENLKEAEDLINEIIKDTQKDVEG